MSFAWKIRLGIAAGVLVVGWQAYTAIQARADASEARRRLVKVAEQYQAAVGKIEGQRTLIAQLSATQKAFVGAAKKAAPGSRVDSMLHNKVQIEGPVHGVVIPATATLPAFWKDTHDRFRLQMSEPFVFERQQAFSLDVVAVRSKDGKTRIAKVDFLELEPATGKPITDEPTPVLKTSFFFADEPTRSRPVIDPQIVAGVDLRFLPIVGVKLLEGDRSVLLVVRDLSAGLMGTWDRKNRVGIFGGYAAYRLFRTNISMIGYYGINTHGLPAGGFGTIIQVSDWR